VLAPSHCRAEHPYTPWGDGNVTKSRFRALSEEVAHRFPDLEDPAGAISAGFVLVDGVPKENPTSMVRIDASIRLRAPKVMRGAIKLQAAIDHFNVPVAGAVALDAGSAAGGFVQTLLHAGARRVYAVEVGYGQLLGSLRQDPRVVNLERVNIAELSRDLVPEALDLVTLDLGYLALSVGVEYLNQVALNDGAVLLALLKPMSELRMGELPADEQLLERAIDVASDGIARAGWTVLGHMDSPIRGAHGAVEFFLYARRNPDVDVSSAFALPMEAAHADASNREGRRHP
jgi:23S rRNA (cytidine1920-2'-O)/16S rRNA (cytidine1409-2'-O)-methyltransferase